MHSLEMVMHVCCLFVGIFLFLFVLRTESLLCFIHTATEPRGTVNLSVVMHVRTVLSWG